MTNILCGLKPSVRRPGLATHYPRRPFFFCTCGAGRHFAFRQLAKQMCSAIHITANFCIVSCMARPRYARPTDAELQILAVLWRRGGSTVRQVYNELKLIRGSGYNSVLKLMQIMHDKELIRRDD